MRKNTNITTFINKLEKGDIFTVNTIHLNEIQIMSLRKSIIDGNIKLDEEELKAVIVPEYQEEYRRGESIALQMTYIKQ